MVKQSVVCCSICLDEEAPIVFNCSDYTCNYCMCAPCVRDAFKDSSGQNSSNCPCCGTPSDIDMITAMCGHGAVKAVERKVRSTITFELKAQMLKKESAKKEMIGTNERAREIFNELTEKINLKCPRCQTVFNDYDGCNALSCGVVTCKAAFCAICLTDCGTDAHEHVRSHHGQLFGKDPFEESKAQRTNLIVKELMIKLADEPFELRQLLKNHIEKAKLIEKSDDTQRSNATSFLAKTRESLLHATKIDRLGLLNQTDARYVRLSRESISPRCVIPSDFRVNIMCKGEDTFRLSLKHNVNGEEWINVSLDNVEKALKHIPNVDTITNLAQSIKCAVIAVEGRRHLYQTQQSRPPKGHQKNNEEIYMSITRILDNGELNNSKEHFPAHEHMTILGFNPNLRMLQLERHILQKSDSELMFTPLKHLIGDGKPTPLLTEILRPVPETQRTLNENQRKVAHPLQLKSVMEVAGPPGTGKTKTIIELVRAMLECTDYDIVVLSERNGAINAVAEKFQEASLIVKKMGEKDEKKEIKDLLIWMSLITHGSGNSMGFATKLFTLEEKLSYHPDLLDLQDEKTSLKKIKSSLVKSMRSTLSEKIENFGDTFNDDEAFIKCRNIENEVEFKTPMTTIRYVQETVKDLESILSGPNFVVSEEAAERVVLDRSAILGKLIVVRTDPEKKAAPALWDAKGATKRLVAILGHLQDTLKLENFNEDNAGTLHDQYIAVKQEYDDAKKRLRMELPKSARIHMSTIGSSHKLPLAKKSDMVDIFGRLSLNDLDVNEEDEETKKAVVIFDEAGCIPSYELLGLSRLGYDIEALILVGDKHQLPPYDPSQGKNSKASRYGSPRSEGQKSLLDSSSLTIDNGKILLTTQYRVPRDIADMLNSRIYNGAYITCPRANVPNLGLNVINVAADLNPRRKYVNSNEVEKGIELVRELFRDDRITKILIITPLKRRDMKNTPAVLTIDQCQGQEADAVILSLVQKPTCFLTKNRLNVALSRVRKKLFVLVDIRRLKEACQNNQWDSAPLAGDLLRHSIKHFNDDSDDSDDSFY